MKCISDPRLLVVPVYSHTPMLLILLPLSSTLVAPKAIVARHKADNKVLNHIVPNATQPRLKRTEEERGE